MDDTQTVTAIAWEDQIRSEILLFVVIWVTGAFTFKFIASDHELKFSECVFDDDETHGRWTRVKDLPTKALQLYDGFIKAPDTPDKVNTAINAALEVIVDRYKEMLFDWEQTANRAKMTPIRTEHVSEGKVTRHRFYSFSFNDEHPVPPPYTAWHHRAWVEPDTGLCTHEEIDAGDSTVSSPYPGEIKDSAIGLDEEALLARGFKCLDDLLYASKFDG